MKRTNENLLKLIQELMRLERVSEDMYKKNGEFDKAETHKRIRWAYDDIASLLEDKKYFDKMWKICMERNAD